MHNFPLAITKKVLQPCNSCVLTWQSTLCCRKKRGSQLTSRTLSNLNRFSKFIHC